MTRSAAVLKTATMTLAAVLCSAFVPTAARANARTITMIGSDAGLPQLHVIYLTPAGTPYDYVQWPGQTPQWRGVAVPVQRGTVPPLAAIRAIPIIKQSGAAAVAVELVGLDTSGHLWSTTMTPSGAWNASGFTGLPNASQSTYSSFDALSSPGTGNTISAMIKGSGTIQLLTESSAQSWTQPGWPGPSSTNISVQVNEDVRQPNGRIQQITVPQTVAIPLPPCVGAESMLNVFASGYGVAANDVLLAGLNTCPTSPGYPRPNYPEVLSWALGQYSWMTMPTWNYSYGNMPSGGYPTTFTNLALGVGNNQTKQLILLGANGQPYLEYLGQGGWVWFGQLPNNNGVTFQKFAVAQGNGGNLQVVGLAHSTLSGANIPYLIWQDAGSGGWNWFGALPNTLQQVSLLDMDIAHASATNLVAGYVGNNGRVYVHSQAANGGWTFYGPLP